LIVLAITAVGAPLVVPAMGPARQRPLRIVINLILLLVTIFWVLALWVLQTNGPAFCTASAWIFTGGLCLAVLLGAGVVNHDPAPKEAAVAGTGYKAPFRGSTGVRASGPSHSQT
jgi:hypothetical protein